jgi:hypothetical protein
VRAAAPPPTTIASGASIRSSVEAKASIGGAFTCSPASTLPPTETTTGGWDTRGRIGRAKKRLPASRRSSWYPVEIASHAPPTAQTMQQGTAGQAFKRLAVFSDTDGNETIPLDGKDEVWETEGTSVWRHGNLALGVNS